MVAMGSLGALALSQLFGIVVEKGKPIVTAEVLAQVRKYIDDRHDNVVKNDVKDGWSATHIGDPKNDYDGDVTAKRIDNFFFLYAKALPGKGTDFFRDVLSASNTPHLRNQVTGDAAGDELATLVGNAIYAAAERLAASV